MLPKHFLYLAAALAFVSALATGAVLANDGGGNNGCKHLPKYSQLKAALVAATATETSGLNNQMWGTIVDKDGIVCAVAFTGVDRFAQWPGSRVISAQKANTAASFSLDSTSSSDGSGQPNGLSLSTANLYSAVQPGGSLYGLQQSNPVDTGDAYKGPPSNYGTSNDPMVGNRVGGVNVFGGGLTLSTDQERKSSGQSGSAATPPALTITSPGGFATILGWITCLELMESPAIPLARTISSLTSLPIPRAEPGSVPVGLATPLA
jgi:hypothetical protein